MSDTQVSESSSVMESPQMDSVIENDGGFFADESVSDAELMGGENNLTSGEENNLTTSGDGIKNSEDYSSTSEESSGTDGSSGDLEKKDSRGDDSKDGDDEQLKSNFKPPKGFVPYQALSEERKARQAAARENIILKQQILENRNNDTGYDYSGLSSDFQFKSDEELEELMEVDPASALKYVRQEQVAFSLQKQMMEDDQKREEIERELVDNGQFLIDSAWEDIKESVPDLFSENREQVTKDLCTFASQYGGLSAQSLSVLTDPSTVLVLADGSRHVLGSMAADLTRFIHNTHITINNSSPDEIRMQAEKELKPKIAHELMSKFTSPEDSFKSLDSLPGNVQEMQNGIFSEDDWSRLSPEEQDKLLRGQ